MLLAAAGLSCAAPLAGVWLAGDAVAPYLDFPPRTQVAAHAPFSWAAFVVVAIPCVLAALLLGYGLRRRTDARAAGPFPWWGALGVVVMLGGWLCAWWEGLVPAAFRRHTFAVIWLGYILFVNGCTLRTSGYAPLTHRTAWYLALFPLSAVFWWVFEYLNQFVRNWYYVGVVAPSDWEYVLQATVPFATVLPAVVGTAAWLDTVLTVRPLPRLPGTAGLAAVALVVGVLLLAGVGVWPERLYPMVWLGPLLLVGALQRLVLGQSSFAPLVRGDWRPLLVPALAGLVCGGLWELWNYGSAAKWHYAIPYVQRFHVFEMPLLGYAGYLPFGVLCILVADVAASGMRGSRGSLER